MKHGARVQTRIRERWTVGYVSALVPAAFVVAVAVAGAPAPGVAWADTGGSASVSETGDSLRGDTTRSAKSGETTSVPRSGTRPGRVGTGSRRTPATTSRPAVTEEPGLAGSSRRAVSGFAPGPVVGRWSERADTPLTRLRDRDRLRTVATKPAEPVDNTGPEPGAAETDPHRSPTRSAAAAPQPSSRPVVVTLVEPIDLPDVTTPAPPVRKRALAPGAHPDALVPRAVLGSDTSDEPEVSEPSEAPGPTAPQPLSPVAELLELPARIVNTVLEALDLTSSADSPTLPVSLAPVNDLIFGTYREIERLLGLWETPPPQPAVPTMTYTGPIDQPTPTVAQFLNASTAAYVLGSTPGDLVPFTVNGFQMSRTNLMTGTVAKTWVTPEGQIIIAYQGTTGGSHLLFNPLIVIPQVIADLQVVFTGTTPAAFHDALDFAEQVRAEAVRQGYSEDDIFVTGHSLGGWQAQFVAQQTGMAGVGFEAPGINTTVPGNGADSMFVNIGTYGSSAPYLATDLPGLQPFMPPFVPGGGAKPHYGPIVMVGDPAAMTPLYNASALWGRSITGSAVFLAAFLMNFFQYHLPGVQAYHLDVTPDPGVVPFLGTARGPVHAGYGGLTIPQLLAAASEDGILFQP